MSKQIKFPYIAFILFLILPLSKTLSTEFSCKYYFNQKIYDGRSNKSENSLVAAAIETNTVAKGRNITERELILGIETAATLGAQLIVTPEIPLGYSYRNYDEARPFAKTIPGNFTNRLTEIAKTKKTNIVASFIELGKDTELLYITAIFVESNGKIHKHRKIHLTEKDKNWASPGNLGVQIFKTNIGRVAIGICMDAERTKFLKKVFRRDENDKPHLFILTTASRGDAISKAKAISRKYSIPTIGVNQSGRIELHSTDMTYPFDMPGLSSIYNSGGEEVITLPLVGPNETVEQTRIAIGNIKLEKR